MADGYVAYWGMYWDDEFEAQVEDYSLDCGFLIQ